MHNKGDEGELDIQVFSLSGEKVYSNRVFVKQNGVIALDIKNLNSGLYFVRIESDKETENLQILVD